MEGYPAQNKFTPQSLVKHTGKYFGHSQHKTRMFRLKMYTSQTKITRAALGLLGTFSMSGTQQPCCGPLLPFSNNPAPAHCWVLTAAIIMQKLPGSVKLTCPENLCHIRRRLENWKHEDLAYQGYIYSLESNQPPPSSKVC